MERKEQVIERIKNLTDKQFSLLLTLWGTEEKSFANYPQNKDRKTQ